MNEGGGEYYNYDDYYNYTDEAFEGDARSTNVPGSSTAVLIATLSFCFFFVAILPCLVRWGEQYERYRTRCTAEKQERKKDTTAERIWREETSRKSIRWQNIFRKGSSGDLRGSGVNEHQTGVHRGETWNTNVEDDVISVVERNVEIQMTQLGHPAGKIIETAEQVQPATTCEKHESDCRSSRGVMLLSQRHVFDHDSIHKKRHDEMILTKGTTRGNQCNDASSSAASSVESAITLNSVATFIETVISCQPRSKRLAAKTPADRVLQLQKNLEEEQERDLDGGVQEGAPENVESANAPATGNIQLSDRSLHRQLTLPTGHKVRRKTTQETVEHLAAVVSEKSFGAPSTIVERSSSIDGSDVPLAQPVGDHMDLGICFGRNALWRPWTIRRGFDGLVALFEIDKELKRILKLAVPFSLSSVSVSVFENIHLALIARYLGTTSVAAATVVDLFIGTTGEFLGGIIDGQISITAHALGVGNNFLAGQYVQQSMILFTICFIPTFIFWWFCIRPAVLWLGMSDTVADIAQSFARVAMINDWMDYMLEAIHSMYEVTDHEMFSALADVLMEFISVAACVPVLLYYEGATLTTLAYVDMGTQVVAFFVAILYPLHKGWLKIFIPGWLCSFSLTNTNALRNLARTALPLAFGELLAYGEWEVLTLFCGHLGPAEVAAWGILGYLWETFETFTESIGDAAEIRVAYHLGRGSPMLAEMSGYKSTMIGITIASVITSVLWIIGEDLPKWYTPDPTLQKLMFEAIPLMGIGNIAMTFGMVSWAIIGAQGRYNLATAVAFVSSWLVTTPLAAIFVYVLGYDIQGLVAAVDIGYSFCGMTMAYIMLRSNWPKLSDLVQERNAIAGETLSLDSGSSSYISSSSSSSSSSSHSRSSSCDPSSPCSIGGATSFCSSIAMPDDQNDSASSEKGSKPSGYSI